MPDVVFNSPPGPGGGIAYTVDVQCNDRIRLYQDLIIANIGGNFDGNPLPNGGVLHRLEQILQNQDYKKTRVITSPEHSAAFQRLNPPPYAGDYNVFTRAFSTVMIQDLIKHLIDIIDPWVALAISLDIGNGGYNNSPFDLDRFNELNWYGSETSYFDPLTSILQGAPPAYLATPVPRLPPVNAYNYIAGPINNFWMHHDRIKTLITTLANIFVHNIEECVQRVAHDWEEIRELFFPDDVMIELDKISPSGSDFHKGGKQVIFLTFNTQKPPAPAPAAHGRNVIAFNPAIQKKRVVYKPSDLELDCRLLGDTSILPPGVLQAPGGAPAAPVHLDPPLAAGQTSLLERIKKHLVTMNLVTAGQKFSTYKFLPKNRRLITTAYGYIEFLSLEPHIPDEHLDDNQQVKNDIQTFITENRNSWQLKTDFILSNDEELKQYYLQWGRLMAMATMFCVSDMHWQNIRNHAKLPHLIDVEDSLKWPMTSVGQTAMTQTIRRYSTLFIEVNELMVKAGTDRSKNITVLYYPSREIVPTQVWRRTTVLHTIKQLTGDLFSSNLKYVFEGFTQVMTVFHLHHADYVRWLHTTLRGVCTRFVPIPTAEYYKRNYIYNAFQGSRTLPQIKQHIIDIARKYWAYNNQRDFNDPRNLWESHPNFLLSTDGNDFRDYENGDIPSYYRFTDQSHLFNSNGVQLDLIACNTEQTGPNPPNPGYEPLNHDFRVQIAEAGNPNVRNYPAAHIHHHNPAHQRLTNNQYFPDTQINLITGRLNSIENVAEFRTIVCQWLDHMYNDFRGVVPGERISFTINHLTWSRDPGNGNQWIVR